MSILPFAPVSRKWSLHDRSVPIRTVASVATVAAAIGLTQVLWLFVDRPVSSPLFLVAIVLSAWVSGFRFGVLTTVLGGLAIDYFFFTPQFQFSGSRDEVVRLLLFVIEGMILSWLIERQRLAGDEINASHERLRALSEHQQSLREEEQKRIAREVHDELGQALTGLKINIQLLKKKVFHTSGTDLDLSARFDELIELTDGTIGTVRRIASELRPSLLDDFGLVAAVEWQSQEFERTTAIRSAFTSNSESIDVGPEGNTAVFRIVQEALTNVARHSGATEVCVDLDCDDDEVRMRVLDNGCGIAPTEKRGPSLGIMGMRERGRMIGGELTIEPSPAGGTLVELRFAVNGHGEKRQNGL